ncbi:phosphoglycerate mutase [Candidatus Rickettsiella isopodorum]|jgi:probable phosphoglycerate mutase|uniref:Phosphoglycerate mutase n=1 Tax=Candidatus Rickettsiella isopodorum TaxID=1225476 RepID=A0A1J8P716_9COXI|nr:histidine phosphatase family protein [Candidatus Rickettsiella isopodorum]OIZ95572.1 phosphoglycerate mutase [Candidatus Rickettsiella isopodorum]
MNVIFSRHGNTFSANDAVVWVGATQDLPLVDSGRLQAKCLAQALQKIDIHPKAVYCGPLKRTQDYAVIVLEELHSTLKPTVDTRLNEIDYGNWAGLSNTQIQEVGEGQELSAWENLSVWPKIAGWSESPAHMAKEVKEFSNDLVTQYDPTDTILVITSNGRLRYFLKLIPGLFEQQVQNKAFKVATGNICLFTYEHKWQMKFWNKKPEYLLPFKNEN